MIQLTVLVKLIPLENQTLCNALEKCNFLNGPVVSQQLILVGKHLSPKAFYPL